MSDGAYGTGARAAAGPQAQDSSILESAPLDRTSEQDPRFSLVRHLSTTLMIAGAIGGLGTWLAWGASPWVWLALPGFWAVANFFEWGIHRGPMHRPSHPRILYRNHTLVHHRAFREGDMEIGDVRELSLVMMPWYTLVFVFLSGAPVAIVAGLVGGKAYAGVFLIAAVTYFLLYEVTHTLHHLPLSLLDRIGIARLSPYMSWRRHHHHHHRLDRMAHTNFNVTFPLADRLLGTYESRPSERVAGG